jgi:alginate O-acetyltransferase complex protein AlgI
VGAMAVLESLLRDPSCGAHFASPCFLVVFLPLALGGYWVWPSRAWKLGWLSAMSVLFYALYDVRFLGVLYFGALLDYLIALGMSRPGSDRRLWLAASLGFSLALLAFFKYAIFVAENAVPLLGLFGIDVPMPGWSVVLPVGISFYTFHAISYTVDVYRGDIPAERNVVRYLAYITMFPHLVAGPIVRFQEIGPQLRELPARLPAGFLASGLLLFGVGLFKKIAVADSAAAVADALWFEAGSLSAVEAWAAIAAYTVQIYFDFSGYSDMALGLAALLGIRFPVNFRAPYQALDPSDFWRRWHVTLGRFLRDYLFIPLGGSRGSAWLAARNVLIVMALGGLWHGADWTFVVWGLGHGALLAAYHAGRAGWDRLPAAVRRAAMLFVVALLWVPFRAPDLAAAGAMLGDAFAAQWVLAYETELLALAAVLAWCMLLPPAIQWRVRPDRRWAMTAAIFLLGAIILMERNTSPFIYYAF